MRSLILVSSILTVALVSAAQSAQARSDTPRETSTSGISKQMPEQYRYHPCPADVVFANGQHACLG